MLLQYVKTYLKGCNDAHAQTGQHPNYQSGYIEAGAHRSCFLNQPLHKLVPGKYGGRSYAKVQNMQICQFLYFSMTIHFHS